VSSEVGRMRNWLKQCTEKGWMKVRGCKYHHALVPLRSNVLGPFALQLESLSFFYSKLSLLIPNQFQPFSGIPNQFTLPFF